MTTSNSSDMNIYELGSTSGKHNITIAESNDILPFINFVGFRRSTLSSVPRKYNGIELFYRDVIICS
jgi:hypothetical protein